MKEETPMLYTSYFAKLKKLPAAIVPVAICGKAPAWYSGLQYKKLAPKYSFFSEWKRTHDNAYYIEHFNAEVLGGLDAGEVVRELSEMTGGKAVALVCYERPEGFCHRHLVADWLRRSGHPCKEI